MERKGRGQVPTTVEAQAVVTLEQFRRMSEQQILTRIAERGPLTVQFGGQSFTLVPEERYEKMVQELEDHAEDLAVIQQFGHRFTDDESEFVQVPKGMTMQDFFMSAIGERKTEK